ncbi:MAG: ABC transporter permease, partial [Verrucomicrobiota bacterium]
ANLMVFGWSLGMISISLILRWGQAAESLAWAVPFMIQPLSAVFYPVSVLPAWVQPIAYALPPTHIFEGMREVLIDGNMPVDHLIWASLLNLVYLAIAGGFFGWILSYVRRRGLLTKVTTH